MPPQTPPEHQNLTPADSEASPPLEDQQPITPPVQSETAPDSTQPHKKSKKKLVLLALIVIILVLAGYFFYTRFHTSQKVVHDTTSSTSPSPPQPKEPTTAAQPFTVEKLANGNVLIGTRTWYKTPVKKTTYTFFKPIPSDGTGSSTADWFSYDDIGSLSDGSTIVAVTSPNDGGDSYGMFLVKGSTVTLLQKESPDYFDQNGKYAFSDLVSGVTTDNTTVFPELNTPQTITVNGVQFTSNSKYQTSAIGVDQKTATVYGQTPYGNMYKNVSQTSAQGTYQSTGFYIQTYGFKDQSYKPSPNIDNLNKGNITFQDGSKNTSTYSSGFHGCGYSTYQDLLIDASTPVVAVAKTSSGQQLYDFSDPGNAEVNQDTLKAYNDPNNFGGGLHPFTEAQFLAKRPTLLYKNSLGSYSILYNDDVVVGGGCGKPVIYLYPQKTTKVSVKVDADIRVSAPAYKNGWTVLASPNGTLTTNDGRTYDSLFWEGYGHQYPDITSGFIVKQKDLASSVDNQLTQLGLNNKERRDFENFWLPKLPTTPYVRLTWFGTNLVNQLAPLHITPTPDTLIRVFLDYEGLQTPINLPPEHLTSIPRTGFTVVEWGGLLHERLPQRP